MTILIRNALCGGELTDLYIDNGRITMRGSQLAVSADMVIEQNGKLAIPGFVDCHAHIDKSNLNIGGKNPYRHGTGAVKGALTREAKQSFTVEDIYRRAERVLQTAIASGTLVMRTNCDVDRFVGLKGVEALLRLKEDYSDRIELQIAAFAQEGIFQDEVTAGYLEEALRMGADLIGGHSMTCGEGERHIDFILELAAKYGKEADFHLDESGNRENYLLPYTAEKMRSLGMAGHVNAIHLCTLAALNEAELEEALLSLREAHMKVTVAPTAISTRHIAPVKRLLEAGIPVGLGSDNIRDFFNPLGSGDLKLAATLLAYSQAFFTEDERCALWRMMTDGGAEVLALPAYGLFVGAPAHVTLFDTDSITDVLACQLQPSTTIRFGRLL